MSDAKRLEYATRVVARDPLALEMGIALEHAENARARVSLVPEPRHLNAMGRVHGTTYYALVDQAMAVAANTLSDTALVYECKVNFLAASSLGEKLLAEAVPVSRGRVLRLWDIKVTGDGGELKAQAQGVTYHRRPEKDPSKT